MTAPAYPPAYLLAIYTDFVCDLRASGNVEAADWWERTLAHETPLEYGDGSISRWVMAATPAPSKAETPAFDVQARLDEIRATLTSPDGICLENIPTKPGRPAHRCTHKATVGAYCKTHAKVKAKRPAPRSVEDIFAEEDAA